MRDALYLSPTVNTTSVHRLNGDKPLGLASKVAYLALNVLNNHLPPVSIDPRLTIREFTCSNLAKYAPLLPAGASPSRKLSDLFWMTLPWLRIQQELGTI